METTQESKSIVSTPVAIIIAGVIIAGAVIFATKQPAAQPAAANAQPQAPVAVDVSKVKTDSEPFIGNANAPVTMAYWYDYQCPFCQRNEEDTMPQIVKNYVDTGKLKVVFKDYEFLGPDSQTLGQFSRAVWAVAPDKFYQWHKAIYDNQGTENTGWATQNKILSITTSVLGAGDTAKVAAFVKSNGAEYQKAMDADKAEGTAMGISGTPGAIIGKQLISGAQPYAAFQAAIDAALKNQ
ncbi:MAG TPA: thioredoxin domain-containing protein [Candidatus Paceibacterota bacterium]|nr:thioredoxin domain-containing protein [Candidatus Paceibacterota bacterium]